MGLLQKAKPQKTSIKMGLYGRPGVGKTFTALLIAEGLAKITVKKTAMYQTEKGDLFYCQNVPSRKVHPEAFDYDVAYTRSFMELKADIMSLDPNVYGQIVIDSITHFWEACKASYTGKRTSLGEIPYYGWDKIKKPYLELMTFLLNSNFHVFICGREGNKFGKDEDGNDGITGHKMKAEADTEHEPHIVLHMTRKGREVFAFAEKDRSGTLAGDIIKNPSFENLGKPYLPYLGITELTLKTEAEYINQDVAELAEQEESQAEKSQRLFSKFMAIIKSCNNLEELNTARNEVIKIRGQFSTGHFLDLKKFKDTREEILSWNAVGSKEKISEEKDPPESQGPSSQSDSSSAAQPTKESIENTTATPDPAPPSTNERCAIIPVSHKSEAQEQVSKALDGGPGENPVEPNMFVKSVAEHQEDIDRTDPVVMFPEDTLTVPEQAERKALLITILKFATDKPGDFSILEGKYEVKDIKSESMEVLRKFHKGVKVMRELG